MPIPRRSFLKTVAASVIPAAALHDLIAQVPASLPKAEPHVIGTGQDLTGKVHPLGYSQVAFKVSPAETSNGLFIIEHRGLMPGGGPPLHLHFSQEEWYYVMEGEVVFQVGDKRIQLRSGESVLAPRLIPHAFTAVGAAAHMLIAFAPAGKMQHFFEAISANPPLQLDAEFTRQHEMQLLGPSPFAKS